MLHAGLISTPTLCRWTKSKSQTPFYSLAIRITLGSSAYATKLLCIIVPIAFSARIGRSPVTQISSPWIPRTTPSPQNRPSLLATQRTRSPCPCLLPWTARSMMNSAKSSARSPEQRICATSNPSSVNAPSTCLTSCLLARPSTGWNVSP